MTTRARQTVVLLLIQVFLASGSSAQQPSVDPIERLYQEAQRYQLGVDRPVDVRKAYAHYTELVKRQPDHFGGYYNLAGLCFEQKRYDLAAGFYRKALEIRSDDADALNNLGVVFDRQGKPARAVAFYRKAIQADPDKAMAHYNIAQTYAREGDLGAALREVETAMRLAPDKASFVGLHGRILGEMGKLSETTMVIVAGAFGVVLVGFGLWHRKGMRAG